MSENTNNVKRARDWANIALLFGIGLYIVLFIALINNWVFGLVQLPTQMYCPTEAKNCTPYLTLNELGDFLAGLFAPLAFFILIIGYFKQNQSQKETEKFLANQTKAMQAQAKALKKQSKITQNQYDDYIKEIELNKPYFQLNKFNEVKFRYAPEKREVSNYFQCRFDFINLKKPTNITLITIDTPILNSNPSFWINAEKLENQDTIEITSNFSIEPEQRVADGEFSGNNYSTDNPELVFMTPTQRAIEKICEEYLLSCILHIHYASEFSTGVDDYKIVVVEGKYKLKKLEKHIRRYSFTYTAEN